MKRWIMKSFWRTPIFSYALKEKIYYLARKLILKEKHRFEINENVILKYRQAILDIPNPKKAGSHIPITNNEFKRMKIDPKLIAYYLPQFYPFKENDEWWGKGTTEWNNVGKSVPQFIGHYQPRLPGELGYYDLRLKENIERQVELAKLYGIYAFCYYYYYFDGKRLLDKPLDIFLESKNINFKYCLCWANEDWTRRFDGVSGEVIMKQSSSKDSYENFIHSLDRYLRDDRYLEIDNKKVIIIYIPSLIPDVKEVTTYWRKHCRDVEIGEIYLIAIKESNENKDWQLLGFDAVSEFNPKSIHAQFHEITSQLEYATDEFLGNVYDYKEFVVQKKYLSLENERLYKAVVPMWDNTPRRNNKGRIYHGSTPELYEKWLLGVIKENKTRVDLDDNIVFINAWNEWGEGAYLEPDQKYGYAYLRATRNAIEKSRVDE